MDLNFLKLNHSNKMSTQSQVNPDIASVEQCNQMKPPMLMGGKVSTKVQQNVSNNMIQYDYINPTESLPVPPPSKCRTRLECGSCINCNDLKEWVINFHNTVDNILLRSKYIYAEEDQKNTRGNIIRIEVMQIIYRKSSIPLLDAKVINMGNVRHDFLENY